MAKKKTIKKSQIKKLKKLPLPILILLLIVAGVYFAYTYVLPYLNSRDNTPVEYSSSQNEEGFYYYTSAPSTTYYSDANDLVKEALFIELNQIINTGFSPTRYSDAKEILREADQSLTDSTKVWNIYDGIFVNALWDSTSWHREHVWPNSRLGMERVTESGRNQASDLHNLRAITPRVNSSRSDRVYTDGTGDYHTTSVGGFFPGDDHKGDVARIVLYMAVMYKDILTLTDDLELLLDESKHYTPEGARMGQLTLLLQWHKEDPVDEFERHRNDVIFEAQGNRNPFIDKPEYVHLIWENKTIEELTKEITEEEPSVFIPKVHSFIKLGWLVS